MTFTVRQKMRDVGEIEWSPHDTTGRCLVIWPSGLTQLRDDVHIGEVRTYMPEATPEEIWVTFLKGM